VSDQNLASSVQPLSGASRSEALIGGLLTHNGADLVLIIWYCGSTFARENA
jgi:hypothetical protein